MGPHRDTFERKVKHDFQNYIRNRIVDLYAFFEYTLREFVSAEPATFDGEIERCQVHFAKFIVDILPKYFKLTLVQYGSEDQE